MVKSSLHSLGSDEAGGSIGLKSWQKVKIECVEFYSLILSTETTFKR